MEAGQIALYVLGALNTIIMAMLGNSWKTSNAIALADRVEMKEAMHLIVEDLKTLNNAVLGEYCKKTDLEELKKEFGRVEDTRRQSAAEFRKELHRFELALVAKGIPLPAEGKLDV